MSKTIFETNLITITSFCGPVTYGEPTRMRIQVEIPGCTHRWLTFNEVKDLHAALGAWLDEYGPADPEEPEEPVLQPHAWVPSSEDYTPACAVPGCGEHPAASIHQVKP